MRAYRRWGTDGQGNAAFALYGERRCADTRRVSADSLQLPQNDDFLTDLRAVRAVIATRKDELKAANLTGDHVAASALQLEIDALMELCMSIAQELWNERHPQRIAPPPVAGDGVS